ncbi:RHS repeat-associated core domain-containing protein [bacterium]|nr:RHS repeat-associated core domain-containing protein [bacterium]
MIPAILGLGGLTARIVATAVIPRVVRAISSSFSTTKTIEPRRSLAVEGISSAPEPAPTPVLSGVSATPIRSRKWGYAGLWHHQTSGLDLATYRAYDAANKRWTSRDPLGEGVDFNLYRYCGNNPISCADPSGLETEALGGIKVQVKDGKTVITTDISLTRSSQLPAIVKGRLHVKVRKRFSEGVMDSEGRSGIWYPVGDYTTKPQVIGPGGSAKQELELNGIKPEFDQIDIVFEFDATAVGAIAPMQEVPGREFSRATFPLVNGYPDLAHPTDEYPPNGHPARSSSPTNPRIPPRPREL